MSVTTFLTSQNYQNYVTSGVNYSYLDAGTSSSNPTIDWSLASIQKLNLDDNPRLVFTGATAGQTLTLILKQDSTGYKNINWPGEVKWHNQLRPGFTGRPVEGSQDTVFGANVSTGFSNVTMAVATQSTGNLIVGGYFLNYNTSLPAYKIARIISNSGTLSGKFDTSFNVAGFGLDAAVLSLAIQSDDKIIAGGEFTTFGTYSNSRIIRFDKDGVVDLTFNNSGFNGTSIYTLAVQSDGKILVGGDFTSYGMTTINRIARLETDGTLDSTFTTNIGTGFGGAVRHITIQPDGKIIAVGDFTSFDEFAPSRVARLNSDGTFDESFAVVTGLDSTAFISAIQSDGKVLVGGSFTTYDGNTSNRLVRLNTDGSYDSSFTVNPGFGNTVRGLYVQPDDKVVAVGDFTSFGVLTRSGILRLKTDATLDTTFEVGTGFNVGSVQKVISDLENKLVVVGNFSTYQGLTSNYFIRLNNGTDPYYYKISFIFDGTYYIGTY